MGSTVSTNSESLPQQEIATPTKQQVEIDECIKKATLLEESGKEAFHIGEDGVFRSTREYPTIILELTDMYLPQIGDCLLNAYSDHGDFALGYGRGIHETMHSHSPGEESVFQGGIPLLNQKAQPYVFGKEPNTTVYVIVEFYGPKAKAMLQEQLGSSTGLKVLNPRQNKLYRLTSDDSTNMIVPV